MKKINVIKSAIIVSTAFLFACAGGGGEAKQEGSEAASAATESAASAAVGPVDTKAKSESKGIGKFTSVELKAIDGEMVKKGEVIFNGKCAACHKTSADKVVGPGLKGITQRRTPGWIMNMISNPDEMTKKDPVAKALFEEHLIQMTFQNVSDEETRQILEFFRENDSK